MLVSPDEKVMPAQLNNLAPSPMLVCVGMFSLCEFVCQTCKMSWQQLGRFPCNLVSGESVSGFPLNFCLTSQLFPNSLRPDFDP